MNNQDCKGTDEMKEFPIEYVLNIVPGFLVSEGLISDVYELLNYMTGDNLFTHALPRASRECAPWLIEQFPWLADIDEEALREKLAIAEKDNTTWEVINDFVSPLKEKYGATLRVKKLPKNYRKYIDPIKEAEMYVGKERIIICDGGDGR